MVTSKGKKSHIAPYSLDEVRVITDQYLDSSAERLRLRLKRAWSKQSVLKTAVYAKEGASIFRAGAQ